MTNKVVHKTFNAVARSGSQGRRTYVCTMEKTDRYGDQVVPAGVNFKNFLANAVALFNHDSNAPIGKWLNVRLQDNQLLADLEFLPKGLSPRVDEIRAMAEHDILKAVSIGFMPKKQEPIYNDNGRQTGFRYLESELCEISLVAVPALAEALAVARSLKISRGTMARVFTNGALVSDHIAQARKAVAQQHKYSATVANIERNIERLWTRIKKAATEAEQDKLFRQVRVLERAAIALTPERLQTADQKAVVRAEALRAEQARADARDPWAAVRREADAKSRRFAQKMEAEYMRYLIANPEVHPEIPRPGATRTAGEGNTVSWRGQRIDVTPTWRGKKII